MACGLNTAVLSVRGTATSGNETRWTYNGLSFSAQSKPEYSNPPPGRSVKRAVTRKSAPHFGWPLQTAVTTLPFVATESDAIR